MEPLDDNWIVSINVYVMKVYNGTSENLIRNFLQTEIALVISLYHENYTEVLNGKMTKSCWLSELTTAVAYLQDVELISHNTAYWQTVISLANSIIKTFYGGTLCHWIIQMILIDILDISELDRIVEKYSDNCILNGNPKSNH